MDTERRTFNSPLEVRQTAGKTTMRGYASVFNSFSENLGGFIERISPGAFDEVLENDVRALFNHDSNLILGRTTSGTLRLSVDERGLLYEVDLPDTQVGRDLAESLRRGDVSQSSFAFQVGANGATWSEPDEDGPWQRTINKVDRLLDVSPVTYPAYQEATAALRSLDRHRAYNRAGARALRDALSGRSGAQMLREALRNDRLVRT